MKSMIQGLALAAGLLWAGLSYGQAATGHPGYADFGDLSGITDAEPTVEISLGPALLGFVSKSLGGEDPELSSTLGKLRSIQVSVFEIPESHLDKALERTQSIASRLKQDNWESAIRVRGETSVDMFMKMEGDTVQGMVVMVVDTSGDSVFLNIVGEIDPEQLGDVAGKFGVSLEDLEDL
ncbi:MAG: DUF4252 domain-containing protein [Pseudomonadota bacterium]